MAARQSGWLTADDRVHGHLAMLASPKQPLRRGGYRRPIVVNCGMSRCGLPGLT